MHAIEGFSNEKFLDEDIRERMERMESYMQEEIDGLKQTILGLNN